MRIGVKIVVKNIEKCFVGSEKGINFPSLTVAAFIG